jgi:hypothetical protein
MRLLGGAKGDLAQLTAQLDAAVEQKDAAAETLAEAEQALDALDGLDPAAWARAEAAITAATSEHDRSTQAVATLYARCADAAEEIAGQPVEQSEAKLAKIDGELARLQAEIAKHNTDRERVVARLEDDRHELSVARVPFLDPRSDEFAAHEQRQRQRREVLDWHVKHPSNDGELSRSMRAEVEAKRANLRRDAETAHAAMVERARRDGTLVEVSERVERIA